MPEGAPKLNAAVWATLIGIAIALLGNIVVVSEYFAKLDARVGFLEQSKLSDELKVAQLDTARQASDLHMQQVDDTIKSVSDNVKTILNYVEQWDGPPGDGGGPTANFPRPSRSRR